MKKTVLACILIASVLVGAALTGCNKKSDDVEPVAFGVFEQNGYRLTSFAKSDINSAKAREMVEKNSANSTASNDVETLSYIKDIPPEVNDTDWMTVRANYAGFTMVTRFFEDGKKDMQSKSEAIEGGNFADYLRSNSIPSSAGLVVKNLILTVETVDYMTEQNSKFAEDPGYLNAPFKSLYSFHIDKNGRLVVQMREFIEISASVTGGGINCNYRQDTEAVYDGENKLISWHTSLGMKISTMGDTISQGYVYEADFTWTMKDG